MKWAAIVLISACGVPEPKPVCRAAGVRVYSEQGATVDCGLVSTAIDGARVGYDYRTNDGDVFVSQMRMLGTITKIRTSSIKCGKDDAVGCAVGLNVSYVELVDRCPEVILAHELAHAAAFASGESIEHSNNDLYGEPFSVQWFSLGALRSVGCE